MARHTRHPVQITQDIQMASKHDNYIEDHGDMSKIPLSPCKEKEQG